MVRRRHPQQSLLWILVVVVVVAVTNLWHFMTTTTVTSRTMIISFDAVVDSSNSTISPQALLFGGEINLIVSDSSGNVTSTSTPNIRGVRTTTQFEPNDSSLQNEQRTNAPTVGSDNRKQQHARKPLQAQQQEQPQNQIERNRNLSPDPNATTLALLYPTGLIGGYRNQAMRFIAFVNHAMDQNITQLLLPSLLWSTRYHNQYPIFFWPVPFGELFDVNHWNQYHSPSKTITESISLPLLVNTIDNSDCWSSQDISTEEKLRIRHQLYGDHLYALNQTGENQTNLPTTHIHNGRWFIPKLTDKIATTTATRLHPTSNATLDLLSGRLGTSARKLNFQENVAQCKHPFVYGGGFGAGVLWNEYLGLSKQEHDKEQHDVKEATIQNNNVIALIHQALVPAPNWKNLAHRCVRNYLVEDNVNHDDGGVGYAVLHARVESDMMVHKCGKNMEKNLTTLFDRVDDFFVEYNLNQLPGNRQLHGTMIAVGREGMQEHYQQVVEMAEYNWNVLNERSLAFVNGSYTIKSPPGNATSRATIAKRMQLPMFECGEGWIEEAFYKDPNVNLENLPTNYYGSILPSILNFWLAVEADVFVGVMKSSWSTDVWTTRYHQGKGRSNFQYSAGNGVVPVPNGGLPPSHKNC